jgi:RNA polymerase-interacting CarD/CdnL/TRCF family regulator
MKASTLEKNKDEFAEEYDYKQGEIVVCGPHGIGEIIDIVQINQFATPFYKIGLKKQNNDSDDLVIMIPVDKTQKSGMRKLSSPKIVKKALQILSSPFPDLVSQTQSGQKNASNDLVRLRAYIHAGGSCLLVATAVKCAYKILNNENKKGGGPFSCRELLEIAMNLLASEFSRVLLITEEEAMQKIKSSLESDLSEKKIKSTISKIDSNEKIYSDDFDEESSELVRDE